MSGNRNEEPCENGLHRLPERDGGPSDPDPDRAKEAQAWLESLSGRIVLGDVVSPVESVGWTGDEDNL